MLRPVRVPVHGQSGSGGWRCFERQLVIWRGSYIFQAKVSGFLFLETGNSLSMPAHSLPQFRDVGHMMLAVPGIKCQVLFQRHDAEFWMAETPFPLVRFQGAQ